MTKNFSPLRFLRVPKSQFIILLLLGILSSSILRASPPPFFADREVKGKILDDKGAPLSNVSVIVKGTTIGVNSADDGAFTIHVPDGKTTLVVSSVGFQTQEIDVKSTNNVSITMQSGTGKLDEVVVVGYATQKRVTVTGSVASVKGTDLQKSPAVNLSNSLAGRLPGVTAINYSGEPGYDGSTIRIRGSNTLGGNNGNAALIVIDGVPDRSGGLDRLNPADIESMSVLKDASAAIYGSRAANGVILITTKRGKTGKPNLSYSFNQGWAQPTVIPKMLNAVQYATMANEIEIYKLDPSEWAAASAAYKATGVYTSPNGNVSTAPFSPDDIKKYADGSDPWGHPNTDWFKAVLKNWSPQSRQNVQLSGGNENVKYMASIGYENQDGYYKNSATGYKQYDFRLNLDAKVNKYINVQLGVTGRQENRFFPTKPADAIFRMLMRGYPYKNAIWPTGEAAPDIENGEQPVVITTNQTGYTRDTRYYLQTNGKLEINIPGVEGLKITGNVAFDRYIQQFKNWVTPWFIYNWSGFDANNQPILTKVQKGPTTQATLNQSSFDQINSLMEAILSYNHNFGGHAVTFQAGITKETGTGNYFSAFRQYFPSTQIAQMFAGSNTDQKTDGNAHGLARLTYFGRVGYNYKEKYIAEFLWRNDGSYNFPAAGRFGFFPGVSAGWRISEEGFFKKNISFINSLKLRASWGQMGNDRVYFGNTYIEYGYLSTYAPGTYVVGGQVFSTLHENNIGNPDITWEVANNYNFGLDGAVLNNHLTFEFDYFQNHRSDILWRKAGNIPGSAGFGNSIPPSNFAKVDNKGFEFNVGYNNQAGDFRYSVSVNGGYSKNKIVDWSEVPGRLAYQQSTGHPIPDDVNNEDGMLLYVYDGVFATQKDVDANTLDYSGVGGAGKLFPGSMKFKDINGDGKIDDKDRVRADKNAMPTFQGGIVLNLAYKSFDLSVLFQGASGGQFFFQTESGTIGNYTTWSYDHRWTIDNPSSVDPRTVDRNNQYFSNRNTYYMLNSNYIRLKNLELGYTLPASLLRKAGIGNLRVYVSGLNLLTWAKEDIYDPESTSADGHYYPQARLINTGVTVTF